MGYSVCWGPRSPGTSPLCSLPCREQGQSQAQGLQAAALEWVWELPQSSSPHGFCPFKGFWNESTLGVFPSNTINMRI